MCRNGSDTYPSRCYRGGQGQKGGPLQLPSNDCSVRNDIRAKWGMIIGYGQLLVAIIVADVDPLPAIPAPAPIPVRGIAVSERYAKEREVIESIDEKTSVAETIIKAVAAVLIEKTSIDESMPASEGCADKAVSTGDEHAPAGGHAATKPPPPNR